MYGLGQSTAGGVVTATGAAAGSAIPMIASSAAWAGPVGAAIAGVTLLIGLWLGRKGPRQKELASVEANENEYYMQQNLAAWQASSKSAGERAAALANFDMIWKDAVETWRTLGEPGERAERERGPGGIVPGTGGNWWIWYRDPIQNDPAVPQVGGLIPGADISGSTVLLLAAVGLGAWWLLG